jgi:septal ring factor EnvC (AmiA/AmiB activator)
MGAKRLRQQAIKAQEGPSEDPVMGSILRRFGIEDW